MIAFGTRVRDLATGFEGVVIARAEYQFSVDQVLVVAETGQETADSRWIETARVVTIAEQPAGFGAARRST